MYSIFTWFELGTRNSSYLALLINMLAFRNDVYDKEMFATSSSFVINFDSFRPRTISDNSRSVAMDKYSPDLHSIQILFILFYPLQRDKPKHIFCYNRTWAYQHCRENKSLYRENSLFYHHWSVWLTNHLSKWRSYSKNEWYKTNSNGFQYLNWNYRSSGIYLL